MQVEILYFDGCPTYKNAEAVLREVLAQQEIEAQVELVPVNTDEEAKKLKFPGSPTIRLDGRDLFPTPERQDWRPGCRLYPTPDGLKGSPAPEMLRKSLASTVNKYV